MSQNTTEISIDEEQLDSRLTELLHQMSRHYDASQDQSA